MLDCDWSSDVCSSDLEGGATLVVGGSDPMGVPTTRMQVFTPALPGDESTDESTD
jgi:hypothetical protein